MKQLLDETKLDGDILCLDWDEVTNRPWDVVTKIKNIIEGEGGNCEKIKFDRVGLSRGGLLNTKFDGLSMCFFDNNFKAIYKRVFVVRTSEGVYTINLKKVRKRFKDLLILREKYEKLHEQVENERRVAEKECLELQDNESNVRVIGSGACFELRIYQLDKESVTQLVQFLKTIRR